jgi:hypothetical protein
MYRVAVALLSALMLVTQAGAPAPLPITVPPLMVVAWPQRVSARSGGSYVIRFAVKNISAHLVYVHPILGLVNPRHPLLPTKVRIRREGTGQQIPYKGPSFRIGLLRDETLIGLPPGYLYGTQIDLRASYRLSPGRFSVEIAYDTSGVRGALAPGKRLWRGRTNPVSVELQVTP